MWGKMIVRAEDEEGGGRGSAQRVWAGAAPKEKEKKMSVQTVKVERRG